MNSTALLGPGGVIFLGIYLTSLIVIGLAGRFARRENSMSDFFLGNRGLGLTVLFLTLYATQYSGLTLVGFVGNVYRTGYFFLVSVTFAMSIVGAYLVYAPKIHRLSRQYGYITIGDFIQQRFKSTTLTSLSTVIFIITLGNYILSNLKAIGYIVEASTGGYVTFVQGIVFVANYAGLRNAWWASKCRLDRCYPRYSSGGGMHFYLWRHQLPIRRIVRRGGETHDRPTRLLASAIAAAKAHMAKHVDHRIFWTVNLPPRRPANLRSKGRTDAVALIPNYGLHANFHYLLYVRRRYCRRCTVSGLR